MIHTSSYPYLISVLFFFFFFSRFQCCWKDILPVQRRGPKAEPVARKRLAEAKPFIEEYRDSLIRDTGDLRLDSFQMYFTSGTTGRPKAVILSHGVVIDHALGAIQSHQLSRFDVWGHIGK